jgi:hypothetical protein
MPGAAIIPPNIVVTDPGKSAYMQKQKPQIVSQADVDTLAARLNIDAKHCTAVVLDDVIEDGDGQKHPARRITVTAGAKDDLFVPEGAAGLDKLPKKKRKMRGKDKHKRVRRAPKELTAADAASQA